ncbi:Hca operon transcriptional activator HcaR [Vibrio stylophorae]|uniref:Hca operon transcriptional activator HcaR n=1 Tax=Vibrio stylophorae TaxID=659351 RepID=A0ABN8DXQ1_9VIBR|nr:HTH-type transcriptional activator IlvY [Vibrio stylophorae]CAH0534761.1 Hca operon transcriptional activator HcaR [Vibrio stylophorae]
MNIKTLQLFLHLCDSRNFGQTAQQMHTSPSALSRIIQRLEADIGQSLFLRDNRKVLLTAAGKQLLPHAQRIVQEWQQAKLNLEQSKDLLTGELSLFCSVTASYSHLPQLLNSFRQLHPQIEIKLSTGDPAQAIEVIQHDQADIAIAAKPAHLPEPLAFTQIGQIPLSVIIPAGTCGFSEHLQLGQIDWQQVPFIVPESGTARERANDWFQQQNIQPNIYAQIAGHEAIVSMVALGFGVGIAPDVVIQNSPMKQHVQRVSGEEIPPFELGLCCKKSRLKNPRLNAFWHLFASQSEL